MRILWGGCCWFSPQWQTPLESRGSQGPQCWPWGNTRLHLPKNQWPSILLQRIALPENISCPCKEFSFSGNKQHPGAQLCSVPQVGQKTWIALIIMYYFVRSRNLACSVPCQPVLRAKAKLWLLALNCNESLDLHIALGKPQPGWSRLLPVPVVARAVG